MCQKPEAKWQRQKGGYRWRLSLGPETHSTSIITTTPIVRENIEEAIGNTANETVCCKNYFDAKRRAQRLAKKQY